MSTRTNEEIVEDYKQRPTNKVFNELLEKNQGLIKNLAFSFSKGNDQEDWEQEATLVMLKMAQEYRPGSCKFATLLTTAIKNRFISYLKNQPNPAKFVELPYASNMPAKARKPGQTDDLIYALNKLPKWRRDVVMKVYFSGEKATHSDRQVAYLATGALRRHLDHEPKPVAWSSKRL